MQPSVLVCLFAVLSIYGVHAEVEQCFDVGKHCDADGNKKCCPPHQCKLINAREGVCVRGRCLQSKEQCVHNWECCNGQCLNGYCRRK
ncbi:unnamed protein product [Schistosoma turkestanicum]|nr:unnamed protein product [Schistosoma turkestanicum]CAH8506209.1 unnamed protein product [Schistosoma turkestanicum]CAH8506212.1 unnamed protein product [Schistosoma turkestanicum]